MPRSETTIGDFGEKLNLRFVQGERKYWTAVMETLDVDGVTWVPVNLTGYTLTGQIRRSPDDASVVATLDIDTTDGPNGEYTFGLDAATTALFEPGDTVTDPQSKYVWDMFRTPPGGEPQPVYYGDVIVRKRVTRA